MFGILIQAQVIILYEIKTTSVTIILFLLYFLTSYIFLE